jgi:hypothetical protein
VPAHGHHRDEHAGLPLAAQPLDRRDPVHHAPPTGMS